MRPQVSALLLLLAPSLVVSKYDQFWCHKEKDDIGDYCAFAGWNQFGQSASNFCAQFGFSQPTPAGKSSQIFIDNQADGYGGEQIFWGNHRADSESVALEPSDCMDAMWGIYLACNGYGGWTNTDYGYIFGECIRK